jgi:RNA polymerase sigma-70 factor (ECF subfamily)
MRSAEPSALQSSDEALVERLRAGDREAFEILYERYFPRIYNFVDRRLRSREDAEETVQEVFFHLFSSVHGFRGEAPFAAWLFGLTRRTLAGRFKRKRHDVVPLADGDTDDGRAPTASPAADPHAAYEYRERLARMEEALSQDLTAEQRALFHLHHIEDRSIQEIARSVAKSEDAVKSHLYRARKLLLAR